MILVVDNNDERRKNTITWLRVKGYMSSGIKYDMLSCYTKPFLTVYVNPTASEADEIKNSPDTISVFICDRPSVTLPPWAIGVTTLTLPHLSIMKIFDERFDHLKTDQIEIVGYACMKNNNFALGGELIELTRLEYLIVSFFMINKNKCFKIYDCSSYFNFKANPEENFIKAIQRINAKCKRALRPPLIIENGIEACFNHEIADYVCPDYDEDDDTCETDDLSNVLVIKIFETN